jgi:hypothetical protein
LTVTELPISVEAALLAPLVTWLASRRWIRFDSRLVTELPWNGRRVDVATLTRTGVSTAYELKLRDTRRALEQASLNGMSFDRSFVVTTSRTSPSNIDQAASLGIGLIHVRPTTGEIDLLLRPAQQVIEPKVRSRLKVKMLSSPVGELDVW